MKKSFGKSEHENARAAETKSVEKKKDVALTSLLLDPPETETAEFEPNSWHQTVTNMKKDLRLMTNPLAWYNSLGQSETESKSTSTSKGDSRRSSYRLDMTTADDENFVMPRLSIRQSVPPSNERLELSPRKEDTLTSGYLQIVEGDEALEKVVQLSVKDELNFLEDDGSILTTLHLINDVQNIVVTDAFVQLVLAADVVVVLKEPTQNLDPPHFQLQKLRDIAKSRDHQPSSKTDDSINASDAPADNEQ